MPQHTTAVPLCRKGGLEQLFCGQLYPLQSFSVLVSRMTTESRLGNQHSQTISTGIDDDLNAALMSGKFVQEEPDTIMVDTPEAQHAPQAVSDSPPATAHLSSSASGPRPSGPVPHTAQPENIPHQQMQHAYAPGAPGAPSSGLQTAATEHLAAHADRMPAGASPSVTGATSSQPSEKPLHATHSQAPDATPTQAMQGDSVAARATVHAAAEASPPVIETRADLFAYMRKRYSHLAALPNDRVRLLADCSLCSHCNLALYMLLRVAPRLLLLL